MLFLAEKKTLDAFGWRLTLKKIKKAAKTLKNFNNLIAIWYFVTENHFKVKYKMAFIYLSLKLIVDIIHKRYVKV